VLPETFPHQKLLPAILAQRVEYERLQSESAQLGSQLADALVERISSVSTTTDVSRRLTKINRENELLQKQLNDLGRRVQTLFERDCQAIGSNHSFGCCYSYHTTWRPNE
jgi:chromosome segregation ATPase